jgi:hypothetical protein
MPALNSSLSDDDAYRLLKTTCVEMWGEGRTQELDGALRTAGRNLSTLFSVTLGYRDVEPDYYDNATDGLRSAE